MRHALYATLLCLASLPCQASWRFSLDNDLFAGQDKNYTSGVRVERLLEGPGHSSTLPWGLWLPSAATAHSRTWGLHHNIYTPADPYERALILSDRPYAGWLGLNYSVSATHDNTYAMTLLSLGLVGPGAGGEAMQDFVHDACNLVNFAGWSNQLPNEPALLVAHERRTRYRFDWDVGQFDLFTGWSLRGGNVDTSARVILGWRYGLSLPDDFGVRRAVRGGLEFTRMSKPSSSIYAFAEVGASAIAHDLFLDGSLFHDTHRVEKCPLVGDFMLGLAWEGRLGSIAFARVRRTREFEGQAGLPSYGAVYWAAAF